MADGKQHLIQVVSGKNQRLGKHWIKPDRLIGAAYGSIFEIKGKDLVPIQSNELFEDIAIPDADGAERNDPGETDNRDFSDTNTAQRLTADDVRQLKEGGASGQELLQALVQGSDTWDKKTTFAKQKWATKKLAKHVVRLRVVRCDARTMSECMFLKHSLRGSPTIRSDALAQVLSMGNVHAGARVLVVDTLGGVVVASVLERLAGYGKLVHLYGTAQSTSEAMRYLNLPASHTSILSHVPTSQLAHIDDPQEPLEPTLETVHVDPTAREGANTLSETEMETIRERKFTRLKAKYVERMANREMLRGGVDSIILASKFDPIKLLPRLLPYLNPSCPFVVFSDYLEPLVACFAYLQEHEAGTTAKLQLSTTWQRDYQIKPGRSHPNMTMHADGGYLLSGLRLVEPPADEAKPAGEEKESEQAAKRQKVTK